MLSPVQKAHFKLKPFPSSHNYAFKSRQDSTRKGDILKIYQNYTGNYPKKFGAVWMGLCFKHEEKTPSLALYPKDSSCYCYGCGFHSDSIDIVRYFEKCKFSEALQIIKKI